MESLINVAEESYNCSTCDEDSFKLKKPRICSRTLLDIIEFPSQLVAKSFG
jgi:hypothetical protein